MPLITPFDVNERDNSNSHLLSITIIRPKASSHFIHLISPYYQTHQQQSTESYNVTSTTIQLKSCLRDHPEVIMCHYYAHQYNCKHTTHALGKLCKPASLIQTPCNKKEIWQTIRMGEDCEECATPANQKYSVKSKGKGKK